MQLPVDRARELTETFAQQGWLDLGQVLRGDELQRWTASFDADWAKWGRGGIALGPAVWASDDGRQWMNQDRCAPAPLPPRVPALLLTDSAPTLRQPRHVA